MDADVLKLVYLLRRVSEFFKGALKFSLFRSIFGSCNGFDLRWRSTHEGHHFLFPVLLSGEEF